jgi:hypothetical protein
MTNSSKITHRLSAARPSTIRTIHVDQYGQGLKPALYLPPPSAEEQISAAGALDAQQREQY